MAKFKAPHEQLQPLPIDSVPFGQSKDRSLHIQQHTDGRCSVILNSDCDANSEIKFDLITTAPSQDRFVTQYLDTPSGIAQMHLGLARLKGAQATITLFGAVARNTVLVF